MQKHDGKKHQTGNYIKPKKKQKIREFTSSFQKLPLMFAYVCHSNQVRSFLSDRHYAQLVLTLRD